jgi:putative colanic acid biosynthesis acetyltransferase WcaF
MLDIAANRAKPNYTASETARRLLWIPGQWLFRHSPRVCFGWRNWLLHRFGSRVGKHVHIYNSARIYFPWNLSVGDWSSIGEDTLIYNLAPIRIGKSVTISHRAHLCAGTHDYCKPDMPLLKVPIEIHDQVWVCTEAFLGPGVVLGEGAVVAARSVVIREVDPWTVVAGNPAHFIKNRVLESSTNSSS